jgi:hypothetical protein
VAAETFPEALTRLRKLAGLTQAHLARAANMSEAAVSRYALGRTLPERPYAERLDAALCARGELMKHWRRATTSQNWPEWARDMAGIEEAGRILHVAAPAFVPGYLQSPKYAELVFRAWWPLASDEEVDRLTKLRTERLSQLPRLRVTAIFPVTALTGVPDEVRKEQVAHLLGLIDKGRVEVHLVPEGSLMLGLVSPLMVFRLHSGDAAVSSDHVSGSVIYEPDQYDRLTSLITGALAVALPAGHSLEVLKELS